MPTPYPAKNRPATKVGIEEAAICKITPTQKTTQDAMRPKRRPMVSAVGAAVKAPKKVPAERMETISALWLLLMYLTPAALVSVANWSIQAGMARMPPMVPVSYLKPAFSNLLELSQDNQVMAHP